MPSFNFFLGVVSEIEVQNFPLFPTWLAHHVTYEIIIIIKTFYMSSRSYGENFVSIRQAVAEKNCTHVLCGQTNKLKCNILSSGEGNDDSHLLIIIFFSVTNENKK